MMDNMEMHNMGEESEAMETTPGGMGGKQKEKYYPTTNISTKKIPDAEDYDVGDEMELHSMNKVVGKNIREDKSVELTLEMRECGIMHKGDKKKMREMGVDKGRYSKMKEKGMA